jgi:hypothetical protein
MGEKALNPFAGVAWGQTRRLGGLFQAGIGLLQQQQ